MRRLIVFLIVLLPACHRIHNEKNAAPVQEQAAPVEDSASTETPPAPTAQPGDSCAIKSDYPYLKLDRKKSQIWEYLEGGYYVTVAIMKTPDAAWEAVRTAARGAPSTVQSITLDGTTYYRALLGPFKTKAAANKKAAELKKNHVVSETPPVAYYAG